MLLWSLFIHIITSPYAILIMLLMFFRYVCRQNKKNWQKYAGEIQQYNRNVKAQEKRRQREIRLRNKRVPGVLYLDDYRRATTIQPKII